jgi:uracil-DNA glycosylase
MLILARLPRIELTLLIGQYAQRHFLGSRRKPSLAATVPTPWSIETFVAPR